MRELLRNVSEDVARLAERLVPRRARMALPAGIIIIGGLTGCTEVARSLGYEPVNGSSQGSTEPGVGASSEPVHELPAETEAPHESEAPHKKTTDKKKKRAGVPLYVMERTDLAECKPDKENGDMTGVVCTANTDGDFTISARHRETSTATGVKEGEEFTLRIMNEGGVYTMDCPQAMVTYAMPGSDEQIAVVRFSCGGNKE